MAAAQLAMGGFMLVNGSDYLDLLDQVQDEIATTRAEVVAQATAGLVAMP